MNTMTKDLERAIAISKEQIEQTLMGIVQKAQRAMDMNGGEGYPLTYTTSEVNGIGSDYDNLIKLVQEMNTYTRVLNSYGDTK
jgi:hypothetical protein